MKCFSLLLGARHTPMGGARFRPEDDTLIRDITFRHFPDGFTVLHADGGWFDPQARRFVQEESRQLLITAESRAALRAWCRELGTALQQQQLLLVEVGPITTVDLDASQPERSTDASHES
jgi:hypothetical protein